MSEHRSDNGSAWQAPSHSAVYLDSAYKSLLREELRCMALKNRSKVLELSQQHLLKQAENSRVKLEKLNGVKAEVEEEEHRLAKHREKIKMTQEEQQFANREIRKAHNRQMSNVALEKTQEIEALRMRASKMREEHLQAIDRNRQNQLEKKKRSHDKIHQALVDSRSTVQNFYANKQRNIIEQTQKQVKNLNMRKTRQQLQSIGVASRKILEIQARVKGLRENVVQRSVPVAAKRIEGEVHPLVRRIESVLNQYTKIL